MAAKWSAPAPSSPWISSTSRLALARELGATHAINPQHESAPEAIRRICRWDGIYRRHAAHATVLRDAVALLAPRGTLGMVGGAPKGLEFRSTSNTFVTGGRTVRGIIGATPIRTFFCRSWSDLFVKGNSAIDRLVTSIRSPASMTRSADALSGKVVKPILALLKNRRRTHIRPEQTPC